MEHHIGFTQKQMQQLSKTASVYGGEQADSGSMQQ